jgi:hypothetical protein
LVWKAAYSRNTPAACGTISNPFPAIGEAGNIFHGKCQLEVVLYHKVGMERWKIEAWKKAGSRE